MCDLAYVCWLEREADRDEFDAYLLSEPTLIDRDELAERRALGLSA